MQLLGVLSSFFSHCYAVAEVFSVFLHVAMQLLRYSEMYYFVVVKVFRVFLTLLCSC